MDPLHSSDSISFSPDFVEPRRFHLMADPSNSQAKSIEYAAGLQLGELSSLFDSTHNCISVQPSMYALMSCQRAAFRASDAVVNRIGRFYGCNRARPLSERQRYDQISDISTSEYTVMVPKSLRDPIYTRHPTSGHVTKHMHPFKTLPRFSLAAHPIFVTVHAYRMLIWHGDTSDKIRQIGIAASNSVRKDFLKGKRASVYVPSASKALPSAPRPHDTRSRAKPPSLSILLGTSRRPDPGVAKWVDQVRSVTFDEIPQDDVGLYALEPSKPYKRVLEFEPGWAAVAARQKTKRPWHVPVSRSL